MRLSPGGTFNDISDSNVPETFTYVARELNRFGLAYLHLIQPSATDEDAWREGESLPATRMLRQVYTGTMISAGGFTRDTAEEALQDGRADLIAFGQLFIANPDLVERFRIGAPLNEPDRATFYGGGEHGYIDYAALEALEA